jgi:hypothetical protein
MTVRLGLTPPRRRASMKAMRRTLRTFAAVLAGLALLAALPAPCGCAPERPASRHADEHACCAPPLGVRAAGHGCCGETPAAADAVPSPVGPAAVAPVVTVLLGAATPSVHRALARLSVFSASSPPLTVLRI